MEMVIVKKTSIQRYCYKLLQTRDEKISIYCEEEDTECLNKTRLLYMWLQFKGYEAVKYKQKKMNFRKEMKTKNGHILKNVRIFNLQLLSELNGIHKKLDSKEDIKLIKQIETTFRENVTPINIWNNILAELSSLKQNKSEDLNWVLKRLLEERKCHQK